MSFTDPFGTDAQRRGIASANDTINAAAQAYNYATGGMNYSVTPDMINQYMSPDVAFRQNAATQGLAQLYGNSGALRSSAAMSGIASTNANIAAQAWQDAFGRASGIVNQNNALAVDRAQSIRDAQYGVAGNKAALAVNQKGWLGNSSGLIGTVAGTAAKVFGGGG